MTQQQPGPGSGQPPPHPTPATPATPPAGQAPINPSPAGAAPAAPPPADPSDAPTIAWTAPRTEYATEPPPPVEPVRQQGGSRARWGIALLVTALIVGVGVGAYVLLSGQRAGSTVVGYVPDQSVMYGEMRLDLPGDQRQKLGQFLARFPGFRDQSTLDVKLDDVFDRVVRGMTGDRQTWTEDIEPWFGGQLGFSLGTLPDPDDPSTTRFLLVANVKDVNGAKAWVDEVLAEAGGEPLVAETYNGAELRLSTPGSETRGGVAFADDKVMLVGDESSLRTAIDSKGNGGFGDNERFRAASGALTGDGLGYFYFDLTQYQAWSDSLSEEFGGGAMPFAGIGAELTPDWMAMQLQARDNALSFEVVSPHMALSPDANRAGALAQLLPPETLFLSEAHDYGATLRELIALFRQEPELAETFTQIDDALAIVGGEDGLLGWMGDGGIAVARNGEGIHGGLVFTPTDRAKAERLLATVRSFAELGGGQAGITIRDEDHNGTEITVIDAGDIGALLNAGMGMGMGGQPLPTDGVPEGRAELAWAVTDQVVVIGVGPSFVRAVLDAGPGASLAENARYQALIGQVGAENVGSFWFDITGVRELAEQFGAQEPDAMAEYERDYKPYLLPLDAIISANVRDGDRDRSTFIVTVK